MVVERFIQTNRSYSYLFLIFLMLSCVEGVKSKEEKSSALTKLQGAVFGTSYNILYDSDKKYQKEIDSLYYVINKSMSTYQANSIISKINNGEAVKVDDHFKNVFLLSSQIYDETDGYFDPTIGAVVNAWDFGPEGNIEALDSLKIDSLMIGVGFDKLKLVDYRIIKPNPTFIDFNAIAKGYAVDVVAEFLASKHIKHYLVEIGGEIRVKGKNIEKNDSWKVGIEEPRFDGTQSVMKSIVLSDESMATSGVYRKFKVDKEGNRYSHIINTKTGYPIKSNILSVSVIAPSCVLADAYATAFKSMGLDRIKSFLEEHNELKSFIIFENQQGEFETISINGFP